MAIREIIGNTITTPTPQADWQQDNSSKPDYIKNKPNIFEIGYSGTFEIPPEEWSDAGPMNAVAVIPIEIGSLILLTPDDRLTLEACEQSHIHCDNRLAIGAGFTVEIFMRCDEGFSPPTTSLKFRYVSIKNFFAGENNNPALKFYSVLLGVNYTHERPKTITDEEIDEICNGTVVTYLNSIAAEEVEF